MPELHRIPWADLCRFAEAHGFKTTFQAGGATKHVTRPTLSARLAFSWRKLTGDKGRVFQAELQALADRYNAGAPQVQATAEPAPEPETAEQPRAERNPAPLPAEGPTDIAAAISAAIAAAVRSQPAPLDREAVKAIIRETPAGLDQEAVKRLITEAVANIPARVVEIRRPEAEPVTVEGTYPPVFARILELLTAGVNVFLVGPTGSGKSHLAKAAWGALHKSDSRFARYDEVSCSAGLSESQLAGWLVPGHGGAFEYRPSPFVHVYGDGGVFLFDELDGADANTIKFVNSALANGHMSIPHRPGGPLTRHDFARIIAAANTWGNGASAEYVGANQLDESTIDRFRAGRLYVDYCPEVEAMLCGSGYVARTSPSIDYSRNPDGPVQTPDDLIRWGARVREVIARHRMRRVVSTRFLRDLAKMTAAYPEYWGKVKTWNQQLSADWSEDEKARLAEVC